MRYTLIVLAILACSTPASASLQITLGNDISSIPSDNNFKDALQGFYSSGNPHDVNRLFDGGANVKVTAAGTLFFYFHGAESGFTNEFVVGGSLVGQDLLGGTTLYTETIGATPSGNTQIAFTNPAGLLIGSLNVAANSLFSALGIGFRVDDPNGGSNPMDALAGSQGFGVFFNLATYNSTNAFDELFFGFDDNGAGPDDNHDDMIVRAVFVPSAPPAEIEGAPEATSVVTWLSLTGIAGWFARRKVGRGAAA